VPDDQLSLASDALCSLGLPHSTPSDWFLKSEGDFLSKGNFFRITRWTTPSSVQYIILYPLTYSSLYLSDLESKPPLHKVPSFRCSSIYVPSQQSVYASILRLMSEYHPDCATMTSLRSDLSELTGYDLLELEGGYVDPEDDEEWDALGISERLWTASLIVKSWRQWHEGEEWMGDALTAVVLGLGRIENLPYSLE